MGSASMWLKPSDAKGPAPWRSAAPAWGHAARVHVALELLHLAHQLLALPPLDLRHCPRLRRQLLLHLELRLQPRHLPLQLCLRLLKRCHLPAPPSTAGKRSHTRIL